MIAQLQMKNFKCYKDCTLNFKNFNVICGPNSSGKSTINQAILLLLQNNHGDREKLISNGKFVHFDDIEEIKNDEISSEKEVCIRIKNEKKQQANLKIKKSMVSGEIECLLNSNNFLLEEEKNIFYLSADRIGPVDVYTKYSECIGIQGENAIGFLAKYKNSPIKEQYSYIKHASKDYLFIKEVNYWLEEIIGEKINVSNLERTDKSRAMYFKDGKSLQVRNKNTGSGLSYVISIIVMVLSVAVREMNEQPTFIIENPEIHLHPIAQLKLMDFLSFMSQYCQIIIETHSDHIIKNSLQGKDGQVIKISKDYKPIYYNKRSKYTLKTLTLGEVQWTAFDIPTIDFHISLFSYLQEIKKEFALNELDDIIRDTTVFKMNKDIYDTRCKRYLKGGKNSKNPKSIFETLPVYMRNVIDHPVRKKGGNEPPRKKYRKNKKEFEDALRLSIDFLIKVIEEVS